MTVTAEQIAERLAALEWNHVLSGDEEGNNVRKWLPARPIPAPVIKVRPFRQYTCNGAVTSAYTRSEARANFKEAFGLQRLPRHFEIIRTK